MKRRRPIARLLLLIVEGPPVAWWAPPVAALLSFVALLSPCRFPMNLIATMVLALSALWTISRWCQYVYYRSVARAPAPVECLCCRYPLTGLKTDVCPECGCSQNEQRAKAARVAGDLPENSPMRQ